MLRHIEPFLNQVQFALKNSDRSGRSAFMDLAGSNMTFAPAIWTPWRIRVWDRIQAARKL
jgi:hypothetical protein